MQKDIEASIIIPTHNRAEALQMTLEFLSKQIFSEPWEVIVVNNNCSDNTDEIIKQINFPVSLSLIHETKKGPSAARNAGANHAKGKHFIFIDNDILVEPDFIKRHCERLKTHPGSWFVGQPINPPEQENTVFGQYRKHLYPPIPPDTDIFEMDTITGQATSMPAEDFRKLNGFDESFHVASGEDRELALRAIKSGIKIFFDPGILVIHNDWAGSSIRDFCNRHRIYTQTEPFFWRKYGNETPRLELVRRNLPPDLKSDGLRLFLWKYFKAFLGSKTGQPLIIGICELFEKISPKPFPLWRLYKLAIAGATYKGFQEGLEIFQVNRK
jgi:GT2 family glycosyltransferase